MGITDGPTGTQTDAFATIWDLAEGFAILARGVGGSMQTQHIHALLPIVTRMQRRAALLERDYLADLLAEAEARLSNA